MSRVYVFTSIANVPCLWTECQSVMHLVEKPHPSDLQSVLLLWEIEAYKESRHRVLVLKGWQNNIGTNNYINTLTSTSKAIRKCPLELKRKWHKITDNTTECYIFYSKSCRPHAGSEEIKMQRRYVRLHKNMCTDDLRNIHLKTVTYITNPQRRIFLNSFQICCNVFENLLFMKVKTVYDNAILPYIKLWYSLKQSFQNTQVSHF